MAHSKRARLADRLHSVAIHVLRHAREADRSSGLSPARLSALSVLVFGGPRTLGELANIEQVTPPTMTGIVQGLEAEGLARREHSARDRRALVVRATRKGEQVLQRAREQRLAQIADLLAPAAPADLDMLDQALTRVFRENVGHD